MNKKFNRLIIAISFLFLISCSDINLPLEVKSPNEKISMAFNFNSTGGMSYSVTNNSDTVIYPSNLSIEFAGGILAQDLRIIDVETNTVDETYDLIVGKAKSARNHYNEMKIRLEENGRKLNLYLRAYDDGAAYRYEFLGSSDTRELKIVNENSEFNLPKDSEGWVLQLESFITNYETEFSHLQIHEINPDTLVGLPLTVRTPSDYYLLISEANLIDYAGMYLKKDFGTRLISKLSPLPDGAGVCVKADAPHFSPWRVIMIAEKPGMLIESNLITNLSNPLQIEDPSWIKPGLVAWPWWSGRVVTDVDFEGDMNTETMKYYTDFAAEFGLEYLLIDALWYGPHKDPSQDITTTIPEIDMPGIIKYANDKNVDVLVWLNWVNTNKQMDEAFALYKEWGIKGIKIDYMNRDDQEMVNFYYNVTKKAADYNLLVDFHGSYKPTGLRRQFPNLMTREGILGLEQTKWSELITPEHNVIIPFTRMVVGPMDYTPGAFDNVTEEEFEARYVDPTAMGTRAHHLAMYVVYDSPLQMVSDHPAAYRGEKGAEFLKVVPASWDETKVIDGAIGDYIVIARKHNNDWFIGAMTDDNSRTFDIPLEFLAEGTYKASIFKDSPESESNPKLIIEEDAEVTSTDRLKAEMVPGGGFAVHLKKN